MKRRESHHRYPKRLVPIAAVSLLVAACAPGDSDSTRQDRGSLAAAVVPGDDAMRGASPETGSAATAAPGGTVAPATAPGSAETSITDPVVLEGLRLYRAQYCGTCHQLGLAGTRGTFGPVHDGLRGTAERRIRDPGYTGSAKTAEAYIRESLLEPGVYRVPGFEHTRFLMPAFTQLTEGELDALVRLLLWEPTTDGG